MFDAKIRIFLWNDDVNIVEAWKNVVENDELGRAIARSSLSVDEVCRDFCVERPDVVVLDIMSPSDRQMGLKIAECIRKTDLLVPILAITKDPSVVYNATDKVDRLGFAGIYHASVFESGVFGPMALRPSLNHWHAIAPEFALVRKCAALVRERILGEEDIFVAELVSEIEALPFSGSVDSWHTLLSSTISGLMRQRGLAMMADRFDQIVNTFAKADPFYMASSNSRKHLSHNVQVFLVGLIGLLGIEPLVENAIVSVRKTSPDMSRGSAIADAICVWSCIALTHDSAYLCEFFSKTTDVLSGLSRTYAAALGAADSYPALVPVSWPKIYHGYVGSQLWKDVDRANNREVAYCELISDGIMRHDSKQFVGKPAASADWHQFLAVLSDELQDWGRERPELPPGARPFESKTWSLFCLENIQIGRVPVGTEGRVRWVLSLAFVARDHPEVVSAKYGSSGERIVRAAFDHIIGSIARNLASDFEFSVHLVVSFVSRPESTPCAREVSVLHLATS